MLEEIYSLFRRHETALRKAGFSLEAFERFALQMMKSGFGSYFPTQVEAMKELTAKFLGEVDSATRRAHNKALGETLSPELRMDELQKMKWSKLHIGEGGIPLPDCIAVCRNSDGKYIPLVFADVGTINAVYTPLTHDTLIVGRVGENSVVPDNLINTLSACSRDFFVAKAHHPSFDHAARSTGSLLDAFLSSTTSEALRDLPILGMLPKG